MAKELLFLLGSIVSTAVASVVLSLSLAIRSLFLPRAYPPPPSLEEEPVVRFYEGRVWHVRRLPVRHAFDYPVRYALVDLDRCCRATAPCSFLSNGLSASEARDAAAANGPVLLLTIPKSVGYEQNPLSVYYCFDRGDGGGDELFLKACIAEVTNTPWGERVNFVFHPGKDLVAKPLHVSPFMDMTGSWKIHADTPAEQLRIVISVQHPTLGNYFTATLNAKRVPMPHSSSLNMLDCYFWLMPHKVAVWIYWHALKLWWKGVSFVDHPKYLFPSYREDAVIRDKALCDSFICRQNDNHHEQGSHNSINEESKEQKDRWFAWKDAQWPWS